MFKVLGNNCLNLGGYSNNKLFLIYVCTLSTLVQVVPPRIYSPASTVCYNDETSSIKSVSTRRIMW